MLNQKELLFFSPVFILLLGVCIVWLVTKLKQIQTKEAFPLFFKTLNWPVLICLSATGLYISTATIIHNSPQGPLAIIIYGPPALALGVFIGIIWWLAKVLPNKTEVENTKDEKGKNITRH